jgi:uncharacterized protein YkwD
VTGLHARGPRSPLRRAAPAIAALALLGVGAWSGTALSRAPSADPGAVAPATGAATPATTTEAAERPATPSPTAPRPSPQQSAPPAPSGAAALEAEVVRLVNAERASAGCRALTVDARLTAAARAHSADMAARDYFDHTSPDGTEFGERIAEAGYRFSAAAENIAVGYPGPDAVMRGWMRSDGHRRNILNCALRHIGVGLAYDADDRPYWTQDFATPA